MGNTLTDHSKAQVQQKAYNMKFSIVLTRHELSQIKKVPQIGAIMWLTKNWISRNFKNSDKDKKEAKLTGSRRQNRSSLEFQLADLEIFWGSLTPSSDRNSNFQTKILTHKFSLQIESLQFISNKRQKYLYLKNASMSLGENFWNCLESEILGWSTLNVFSLMKVLEMITSIRGVVYHQDSSDCNRLAERVEAVQESLPWASSKEVDLECA